MYYQKEFSLARLLLCFYLFNEKSDYRLKSALGGYMKWSSIRGTFHADVSSLLNQEVAHIKVFMLGSKVQCSLFLIAVLQGIQKGGVSLIKEKNYEESTSTIQDDPI